MRSQLLGAFWGLLFGLGVFQLYLARRANQMTLVHRLTPMFDTRVRERVRAGQSPVRVLLGSLAVDLGRLIAIAGSSSSSVSQRLATLGRGGTVTAFRTEQLAWAAIALVGSLALIPLFVRWRVPVIAVLGVIIMITIGGALTRDTVLTWQVEHYRRRLTAQLPDVAELLGLALTAGEGPIAALTRVSSLGNGELTTRLRTMLGSVHSGVPLASALRQLGQECGNGHLERFADSFVTALELGTPLARVLSGLAADLRAEQREALMESGGKREIGMLVPVVFLIMPISILFALFPAAATLTVVTP